MDIAHSGGRWQSTSANALTVPDGTLVPLGCDLTPDFGPGDGAGSWGFTINAPLVEGIYDLEFIVQADPNCNGQDVATLLLSSAIIVDGTFPTVLITTPPVDAEYVQGVVVNADFSCDDAGGSGIDTCVGTVDGGAGFNSGSLIDTATPGVYTLTVTATDLAGNVTVDSHSCSVGDVTPPTVTITTPVSGFAYDRNASVLADFTCSDEPGGSGLVSCVGDLDNGAAIDTATLGSFSFTVTATDGDGNSTPGTHNYTVRDVTPPAVAIVTPANGFAYDRNASVLADFTCSDEPGGSGLVSCVGDLDNGAAIDTATLGSFSFTVTATDGDGNVTPVTHNYTVRDVTYPTVTIVTPANGFAYDRNALVLADFSCSDELGGSGIDSCVGDLDNGAAIDTATLGSFSFTVTATDGDGNSTPVTHNYTVRDVTYPTVTIVTPAAGFAYDRNASVLADFSCSDELGGSGIDSCVGDLDNGAAIDTATMGSFSFTVTATDGDGNSTPVTHNYTVLDVTYPTVTIVTPAAGFAYDRNASVLADFSCSDELGGSGLVSCVGDVDNGLPIDTTTAGPHSFTVTATDGDGNSTPVTHNYTVLDVTPPTVTITTPAEGAIYDPNATVIVLYVCSDELGGSGIDSCIGDLDSGTAIDTATLGSFSFTVTATDGDGNSTPLTHNYMVLDVTPPTVAITTPANGAVYDHNELVVALYVCSDGLGGSGVVSCVGDVDSGAAIDTADPGPHSFTVTAIDGDSNSTPVTHYYTVLDLTSPTVFIDTPADGAVYGQNASILALYSCSDELGGSGIDSCVGDVESGASIDTSVEGDFTFTVTATDLDSNEAVAVNSYSVDGTAPTVTFTTPADGDSFAQDELVTASFFCTDLNLLSCVGDVDSGEAIDTSVEGNFTFTVTATDLAGNETVVVNSYSVDGTAPVVTAPSDIVVDATGPTGTPESDPTIVAFLAGATAIDAVDGNLTDSITHDGPTDYPLGDTLVTFSVTDSAGNTGSTSATVSITVTVVNNTPPVTPPSPDATSTPRSSYDNDNNNDPPPIIPAPAASGGSASDNSDSDSDRDGDGYNNITETDAGSDPDDPNSIPNDRDGDGYSNLDELAAGSDPDNAKSTPDDRDGDGFSNAVEMAAGSDPDDPNSTPNNVRPKNTPVPQVDQPTPQEDGPTPPGAPQGDGTTPTPAPPSQGHEPAPTPTPTPAPEAAAPEDVPATPEPPVSSGGGGAGGSGGGSLGTNLTITLGTLAALLALLLLLLAKRRRRRQVEEALGPRIQ